MHPYFIRYVSRDNNGKHGPTERLLTVSTIGDMHNLHTIHTYILTYMHTYIYTQNSHILTLFNNHVTWIVLQLRVWRITIQIL